MSATLKSTGWVNLGQKFGKDSVDRLSAKFSAIWERHGAVVCKRNRVDIFYRLSTMHERDRHTDQPRNGNIDKRNHFLALSPNNSTFVSHRHGLYKLLIWQSHTQGRITNHNKKAQLSLTNPRDAKACQNCANSTCLQRCRWQYWPIFMRLTAVASEIREIPKNSMKIQTYGVQGHPTSSILVPIKSPYVTCY